MKAVNLKVEYMTNPIGISYICPRFSWTDEGEKKAKCLSDSGEG